MSELPKGWAEATLGEVAELIRGVTYKSGDSRPDPAPGYLPMLRATNFAPGAMRLDLPLVYVPDRLVGAEQVLRIGDIVLAASSGSASVVGKSAAVRSEWRGSFGAFCYVVRPHALVPAYVEHFAQSPHVRDRWSELSKGTNINNLRREHVLETRIPIPPLAEQQRIAAAVDEQLSRLEATTRSVSRVRRQLPFARLSSFGSATQAGEVMKVGDLVDDIEAGRSFLAQKRPARSGEWAVIKVSAMTWGSFRPEENKALPPGADFDPRFEIAHGDLLLSRANTASYVGATVLVERSPARLLLSDKSMRLHVAAGVDKRWLFYALNAPETRRQMSDVATGTKDSMRNISQEKVRRLTVRVPPLDEQRRLVAEVERQLSILDSVKTAVDHALVRCGQLRRSILERAFTGKLVPQDPDDEPAEVLLERIQAERAAAPKPGRAKKPRAGGSSG